jgi:FkbM family methyltransferase
LCGNGPIQNLLGRTVKVANLLRGVGTGAALEVSGEDGVLACLRATVPAPRVIFDVGCNRGDFVDMVLRVLGPTHSGALHAFEPAGTTFEALADRFGSTPGVVLNRCALGRVPGTFRLHYDRAGSGLASLTKRDLAHLSIHMSESEEVAVRTLDEYCATAGVTRIDLLKIDVEGHELDVLGGASAMFDERRIGMVAFEFGGCNLDTRTCLRDFFQHFDRFGMTIHRVTPSGHLHAIDRYCEADELYLTTNFVACPRR